MPEDHRSQPNADRSWSVEKTFLAAASVFGLLMMFINPPFQAPDEWNHFYRSYYIAQGNARSALDDVSGLVGGVIPADLIAMEKSIFYALPFSTERYREILYYSPEDWTEQTPLQRDFKRRRIKALRSVLAHSFSSKYREDFFMSFPNTAVYFPGVYAPQALVMAVLSRLDADAILLVYFGRGMALAFWIAVVYAALRVTPIHRKSLAALALMPTSLYQASSLSGDTVTNAVAFLFFAVTLGVACGGSLISVRRMGVLCALGMLVALNKFYFFLAGFVLIIPAERFASRRHRMVFYVVFLAAVIAPAWLWIRANSHLQVPLMPGVDQQGQLSYILHNPLDYALVAARTFRQYGLLYLHGLSGNLGHYGLRLPLAVSVLYTLGLTTVILSEARNACRTCPSQRWLAAALFCMSIAMLATIEYVYFTPLKNPVIQGMQGRHLIPFMPLAFMVLPPIRLIGPLSTRAFWGIIIATLSYTVWMLIRGYYMV